MTVTVFQCCFCARRIETFDYDVGGLLYTTNADGPLHKQNDQQFWCHADCFKKALHPSVPLYIFDLAEDTEC